MAKKAGTALVRWDEELAKQAEIAKKMEDSTATGQFFSMRAGQLAFNGSPVPDNQMGVVIVDAILENVFYEGKFDADTPSPPTCFAFGRDENDMSPHDIVRDKQNDTCKGCPMNEWATADTGRGKACRNTRRLALLPAGTYSKNGEFKAFDEAGHYQSAQLAYMKLPVTSVKGYAAYVKSLAAVLKRPPHGVMTKVTVMPDAKTQFKVVFEPINKLPDAVMGAIMKRHAEAKELIAFPYQPAEDDTVQARSKQGKGTTAKQKAGAPNKRPGVKRGGKY